MFKVLKTFKFLEVGKCNILSFGDSHVEREAVQAVCKYDL